MLRITSSMLSLAVTGFSLFGAQLTDPQIAAKLGVSVQQLHSLEAAFGLSDDALLALASYQLQLMLEDLNHPGMARKQAQQQFQLLRMMDEHGHIPPDGLMRALEQRKHVEINADLFPGVPDPSLVVPGFGTPGPLVAGISNGGWTWLGPGNIGGRVRSILVHPVLTTTLWCGGVDGGVWKSTNNGASWYPLNDFMANLAISCMAMDPTNPDVIYAGTGEPMHNADSIRGAGIFKTTDGGATWTQLAATANSSFLYVSRLTIDPNNGQVILASTRSGIFRSVNGGASWSQRTTTETLDVAFHPTDSTRAVASGYNGQAFYSTDGGLSWTAAAGLPAPSGFVAGRVEVAYARSSPNSVFASVDNSSGQIYGSTDGGQTYTQLSTGYGYLGGQGWYDNVIWVDPTTTNVLVVGGIDLWRSTDGGLTLTKISQWQSAPNSAHADHHAIVSVPNYDGSAIRTVYFGNDGGVYRANNVATVSTLSGWQSLNNNLGITQFYGGAGNASSGTIVGGTQDNGTLRYTPGAGPQGWTTMFGGDGGFCAADPSNSSYFYGEYVYLQIHRSANGGSSSSYIYSGITDAGSSANFIAPFILDPNNPNTMLAGGVSLWRSVNVKASPPSWAAIKPSISSSISAIAVAPGNSDIIWVGHNSGAVYSTANGTSATPTWFQRNLGTPNLPARYCERIAITPGNPNKVYVSFGGFSSGNVWRTLDGGVTWANISGNLPAAPVNSITIAPNATNTLYVGTEVGVYGTSNDGVSWSTGNDGPANVSVDELFWMSNRLVAVTHGRGMFSITPALGPANLVPAGTLLLGGNGNGLIDPNECDQLSLTVLNNGGLGATNITATITTSVPGVTIVQGAASYPDLPGGASGTNNTLFQVSTGPDYLCGTPVAVTLNVTYNGGSNTVAFVLPNSGSGYSISPSGGAVIVPGDTDIGNHGDDVTTTIALPFTWTFYGLSVSNATLSSNGNLQFLSANTAYNNVCLPYAGFNYAILPLWDDLRTDGTGQGIFTSVSGSAPNRIFNIEWRASYLSGGLPANFEIRLYEGQPRFDLVYGTLNGTGTSATVGAQSDTGSVVNSFGCNGGVLSDGLQLTFTPSCTDGGGPCVPGLAAAFAGSPTNGPAPLAVTFTNLSTGATNYTWFFGDGNTSSATNALNTYSNAGLYSVTLSAVGGGLTNTLTLTNYIVVTNAVATNPPLLVVSPASLDFGIIATGATAQAALLVSNAGSLTLTGTAAVSGPPFSFGADSSTPLSLAAFSSTNLVVSFTPLTEANFFDQVVFVTDGGFSTNALSGQGISADPPLVRGISRTGTNVSFSFATTTGRIYYVEFKNTLDPGLWQVLETNIGDGTLKSIVTPAEPDAQRYYRLRVQ